jgi:hypothetical protein
MCSLKVAFQPPAKAAAAAAASVKPAAVEDVQLPFDVLKQYGNEPEAAAGARRRLRSSSSSGEDSVPVLGFVMAVAAGAAGQAVVQRLEAVETVKYVENDVCIRVTQGEKSCLLARMQP